MKGFTYTKGKGVFVGKFSEQDLQQGKDKLAIEKKMKETGLGYINQTFVKKQGVITGIKVWVCNLEDVRWN